MISTKNENLVEFKVGKMYLKEDTVYPDKRKGMLFLFKTADGLVHMSWKDRISGIIEDDFILFPEDIEIKKLNNCKTGRIYQVKFKSSQNKQIFWMQESKVDSDETLWKKVLNIINGESIDVNEANFVPNINLSDINDSDLHSLLGGLNRNQLMEILSSNLSSISKIPQNHVASSKAIKKGTITENAPQTSDTLAGANSNKRTNPPTTSSNNTKSKKIDLALLQDVLTKIGGTTTKTPTNRDVNDLSYLLRSELITKICGNSEYVNRLMEKLPPKIDSSNSVENYVKENLLSPQFKQAFRIFHHAFLSGQLKSVFGEFGFDGDVLKECDKGDWLGLIRSLANRDKKA